MNSRAVRLGSGNAIGERLMHATIVACESEAGRLITLRQLNEMKLDPGKPQVLFLRVRAKLDSKISSFSAPAWKRIRAIELSTGRCDGIESQAFMRLSRATR